MSDVFLATLFSDQPIWICGHGSVKLFGNDFTDLTFNMLH